MAACRGRAAKGGGGALQTLHLPSREISRAMDGSSRRSCKSDTKRNVKRKRVLKSSFPHVQHTAALLTAGVRAARFMVRCAVVRASWRKYRMAGTSPLMSKPPMKD